MSSLCSSNTTEIMFILTGIPGLEAAHIWLSIPFSSIYLVALVGNCTILLIIKTDPSLHEPMYYFLSMLALTDMGLSLSTMPTVLRIFWLNSREISFDACFAQLYFVHTFSFMESTVLLAMAFDRYMAICKPLRYASILNSARIAKIGVAIPCRCIVAVTPSLFLLRRLPFCRSRVLSHSYCLHQDMLRLVCADTTFNSRYGLAVVIVIIVLDPLLIVVSYIMIIKTVVGIASPEERLKAFNNCLSHIFAVLVLYIPMVGLSLVHRFGKHTSPLVHVLMANIYLLVPPVLNPIIYSIKTKQIRKGVLRLLGQRMTYSD
ncbi:olfactory receptor 51Q1 [Alligator mississippiensis]|uniref:Olfactory receptor n=1 Tax=Alligator mississippiensis TaxID=8496 RepID=A0A151PGR1_ALLMI|nr:olfactory receptor 51Q1 [Alligator mississippiensis]KYO47965.1 olfactory receptor 51Q1 [Alligator mississippiensis]